MSTRFSIDATFKALDKFSGPVAKMTTRMDRFSRATRRGLKGVMRNTKRMVRGMRTAALTIGSLTVAAGFGLKGLLGPSVKFEQAIAGINAVTRNRIKEEGNLNKVRERALELGGSTIYTTIQVANAMESLGRAGLKTNEILGGIQPILHAAGAEGAGIEETSKVIISTMKAFHKEMNLEETTKTADTFASVASSAKTNILELAEGVSKFAPVAKELGFSMENTIAMVAALQDVGIEASMSGTQLKTMMSLLTKLNPTAQKLFRKLGIKVFDNKGELKNAPAILKQISDGLGRAGTRAERVRAMTEAFGQRGGLAGLLLSASAGKKSGGISALFDAAGESAKGAAEQIYNLRQQTTAGAFRELKSAWETFRIKIGESQLPVLKGVAESLTEALRNPANIKKFAGYLDGAVKGVIAFWHNNKTFMIELARAVWSITKLAWGVVKAIGWAVIGIGKVLGKTFDFADTLSGAMPGADAFNSFMAGFAPDPTGEQYRTQAHVGAPWAPGEVQGMIVVKAEQGTSVSRAEMSGGTGINLRYSGQDSDFAGATP